MKTENAILAGLGVAIAGFFGYRYFKRKRDEKAAAAASAAAVIPPAPSGGVTTQAPGFSDYQKKVMQLQTKLGIGVDGNPGTGSGSQTNTTVKSWFPTLYAKLGNVSASNVDQYIAAQKETATAVTSIPTVTAVKTDYYTKGSITRLTYEAMQKKGYALVTKNTRANAYYYNSVTKLYIPTGGGFDVKASEKLEFKTSILTDRGILAIIPTTYGNKLLLLTSSQIYVP